MTTETAPQRAMSVYDCIVAVSRDLAQDGISKTRQNAQQGYPFRGIDDVLNALSPLLAKHRLVILPRTLSRVVTERQTQKGGVLFSVTLEVEYDFVSAADGSVHTVKVFGEAMDSADKASAKALSASYKSMALQTFCVPTEGDNDADAVTHEVRAADVTKPSVKPSPARESLHEIAERAAQTATGAYRLIDKYKLDAGGWHQIAWGRDAQGGAMIYKTKLEHVGLAAQTAYEAKTPVKIYSKKFPFADKVEPFDGDGVVAS